MKDDRGAGLTIISRCGQEPTIRLVSERVASWEWESFPRLALRPRYRQRGLAPWRPTPNEAKPSNNSELEHI
jgi:hypothetical protein